MKYISHKQKNSSDTDPATLHTGDRIYYYNTSIMRRKDALHARLRISV